MFATGIENSYPTIKNGGRPRSTRWRSAATTSTGRTDFDLRARPGHPLPALRPAASTGPGSAPGRYDWEFADETFGDLKRRWTSRPIVDLCHFGVPDWLGNFQNPDFPALFADYAARLRRALPVGAALHAGQRDVHLRPASRPRYGWWNEQLSSDHAFVTALKHIVQGQRAGHAGDPRRRGPTPSSSRASRRSTSTPTTRRRSGRREILNSRALPVARPQLRPPRRLGDVRVPDGQRHDARGVPLLPRAAACKHHCIMGNDYYVTNEHRVAADGSHPPVGRDLRLLRDHPAVLRALPAAGDAHRDQHLARARTATRRCDWLWKEWANVLRVRNDGVPIVGFTWYSLTDQVDWDTALREDNGQREPARPLRPRPQHPRRWARPTSS